MIPHGHKAIRMKRVERKPRNKPLQHYLITLVRNREGGLYCQAEIDLGWGWRSITTTTIERDKWLDKRCRELYAKRNQTTMLED